MTSDTGNKVLGEQQADVPRSRGGTDRRCKNNASVELIPDPKLGGFTARILDIPAYGEGETEDEAIVDLKEALRAYIEAFGIDDALARANVALTVRPLDWTLQDLTPPRG